MKKKVFKTAPLPFQGQKRRFAGGYATALSELSSKRGFMFINRQHTTPPYIAIKRKHYTKYTSNI